MAPLPIIRANGAPGANDVRPERARPAREAAVPARAAPPAPRPASLDDSTPPDPAPILAGEERRRPTRLRGARRRLPMPADHVTPHPTGPMHAVTAAPGAGAGAGAGAPDVVEARIDAPPIVLDA